MDECCSCHINPPCTYCTSHSNCEKCDAFVDNDDMIEVEGCWICQDCEEKTMSKTFREELCDLINHHSQENGSDTPDFILAEYLGDCLVAFDKATARRTKWYKHEEENTAKLHEPIWDSRNQDWE